MGQGTGGPCGTLRRVPEEKARAETERGFPQHLPLKREAVLPGVRGAAPPQICQQGQAGILGMQHEAQKAKGRLPRYMGTRRGHGGLADRGKGGGDRKHGRVRGEILFLHGKGSLRAPEGMPVQTQKFEGRELKWQGT